MPSLSKEKAPARVYACEPSSSAMTKKPPPWMATLVASRVFSIAPWLNTGEMAPVVTPRPTCIGFTLDPPTVWLTRSWKVTELALKPTVLMFARLFPITLRYAPFALRPERPAENEPTAIMCAPCAAASLPPPRLRLCGRVFRRYAERGADLLQLELHRRQLLERAELGKLSDELAVSLRLGGILVLQLRDEQLQECILAQVLLLHRRGLVARVAGLSDPVNGHSLGPV